MALFMCHGDGSAMDMAAIKYTKEMYEDTAVEMEWQPGDVALLDSMLVMHAAPCTGIAGEVHRGGLALISSPGCKERMSTCCTSLGGNVMVSIDRTTVQR